MGALPPKDQTAHEWLNDFAVAWRADAKNTDGRVAEADVGGEGVVEEMRALGNPGN